MKNTKIRWQELLIICLTKSKRYDTIKAEGPPRSEYIVQGVRLFGSCESTQRLVSDKSQF